MFPSKLISFCRQGRDRTFEWGVFDCVTWAADWVHELTGIDPISDIRGSWHDAASAVEVLTRLGGLRAAATSLLGAEAPLPFTQRGDVVLVEIEGREALGVCVGPYAITPAPPEISGTVLVPMTKAVASWRVAWA